MLGNACSVISTSILSLGVFSLQNVALQHVFNQTDHLNIYVKVLNVNEPT